MGEDLREIMLNMMSTLTTSIMALDKTADELVRSSNLLEEPVSGVMLMVAREHRVKILEMQGQLAALGDRYVDRFGEKPESGC